MTLLNTSKINHQNEMTPYVTVVTEFIDGFHLPSFSYPEVYEFFVVQKDLGIVEVDGDLYFDFDKLEDNEIFELIDEIKNLDSKKELYFQRKNDEVQKAQRAVRKAEHELADAEMNLSKVINESSAVVV